MRGPHRGPALLLNARRAERVPFRWPIRVGTIGKPLSVVTPVPDLYG